MPHFAATRLSCAVFAEHRRARGKSWAAYLGKSKAQVQIGGTQPPIPNIHGSDPAIQTVVAGRRANLPYVGLDRQLVTRSSNFSFLVPYLQVFRCLPFRLLDKSDDHANAGSATFGPDPPMS
jgi:hypothetical protein